LNSFRLRQFRIFHAWSEKGDGTPKVPKLKENLIHPSIREEIPLIGVLCEFTSLLLQRIECIKHPELPNPGVP
jgi:hypothetical protein